MPLSSLSWLLFSLGSPWQLSPSLHYQTTCLNCKKLIHIFSRNIIFQELLGAWRSEQLNGGFLLSCAHATAAGISLGWDVCWGGGGCREVGFNLSCDQTGLAKCCQRVRGISPMDPTAPPSVPEHGPVLGSPGADPASQQHHGWWDPAQEKPAQAMQPREDTFYACF